VSTEERQLSDLLHRLTPEPPRGVTVEDVASRLASQAGQREPRRGRWVSSRAWAPLLAAASVFVVAGASAGIAVLATSHHGPSPSAAGSPTKASSGPASSGPASSTPPQAFARIPGGPWDAELINGQTFTPDSLVSAGNSLYALAGRSLNRIDPATGRVVQTASLSSLPAQPPLVLGNTVWLVTSYSVGTVVLHGYDAQTLAQVASVMVPAIGRVSSVAQGMLASGPDGNLYLAAGDTVAVLDPATNQVIRRIYLPDGPASSVAVSPDGTKLYVGLGTSSSFTLRTYDLANDTVVASSSMNTAGGNLVATSGGVWGTTGSGMSEWVWFAPGGDLSRAVRVGQGAGGGLLSVPTLSGGTVWVGGSHDLVCASPATGTALATVAVPADRGTVENFDSLAMANGYAYAYYVNGETQQMGLARMSPPLACTGTGSAGS
jgi:glutamine cyclotransferase